MGVEEALRRLAVNAARGEEGGRLDARARLQEAVDDAGDVGGLDGDVADGADGAAAGEGGREGGARRCLNGGRRRAPGPSQSIR